jgi:hypothetical protein
MDFWNILRWLGACAAVFGGLSFILGTIKARRGGYLVRMQRGMLAIGVGSLFTGAYLAIPADAQIPKLVAVLISAALMLTGASWVKRAADEVDSNRSR